MYSRTCALVPLCSCALVLLLTGSSAWAYQEIKKEPQPEVSGTRGVTPGVLLDDFSLCTDVNAWGGSTQVLTSQDANGNPTASITKVSSYKTDLTNVLGRTRCSLRLDYDVRNAGSFAWYTSPLLGQGLAGNRYLSFWVKGAQGGEFFKIEVTNSSTNTARNRASVYITDYLDGGVTTQWQKVVIPLDSFVNLDSLSNMNAFNVVFENTQASANGSPLTGTIYIDNIIFGKTFLGFARIDHFGDKVGPTALGGSVGVFDSDGAGTGVDAAIAFSATSFRSVANGLVSTYTVNPDGAFAGVFLIFGGGSTGFTAIPHDFTPYRYVTLWAKARSEPENPKEFKVELASDTGVSPFVMMGLTTIFQQLVMDMGDVASLEGSFKQLNVVYEKWRIQGAGGALTGAVIFDEIQIESPEFRVQGPDRTPPPAPTNFKDDGVIIANGHPFGPSNTLTATVAADVTLEHVRFEYSRDGVTFATIGYDFDTSDTAFSVQWDTLDLPVASDYQVRVVAHDAMGNETTGQTFVNCQVAR